MSQLSYARAALAVLAVTLSVPSVSAQTPAVIDPRIVEFDPSPDHSSNDSSGLPIVVRYDLELYLVGSSQPARTLNLGKPAPQSDGKIRVDFTSLLTPWPAPGTVYEGRVAAVGQTITARSTESNTFSFSSPCSASISPTSVSLGGAAGTGSVAVTAATGCAWTASSNASWLTVTAGANGSGNGTVSYSASANASTTSRSATLTIAGLTFTVTQSAGCTYSISPSATSVSASATTGSVSVTAMSGCPWTASSGASWITVTSGASGSGPGTVGYSVAANPGTAARTGTVTIAGRSFTISQDAAACTFGLSPVSASLAANAASASVAVSSATGCAWTAATTDSWITVTSGATGNGNGQVGYSVAANPSTSSRTGSIAIAGQSFVVTQAGQTCTFSISPVSVSAPADATSGTVSVDTLAGCAWTATSSASWISIASGGSGNADGTVAYNIAANTALTSRTGTVTIGGQTFTVTQAGVTCSSTIAPVSASVGSSGGSASVAVTLPGACAWTATSPVSWITITSGASGNGNGSVGYTVAANTSTSGRSANLTIAGRTFAVSQSGITCSYTVLPTAAPAVATAGSGQVTVTAADGCAWTASSAVSWMSITSGASGSGGGTVGYSFLANPTTVARSGVLTVAGQAVTITQAAGCGYTVSPTSASLTASAGSGTITVTAGTLCAWTALSPVSWITFSTAAAGTGNGSVGYVVAANNDSSSRSATITVGGQPFVITQAGAACDASLTPSAQNIGSAGGNGSVDITVPGGCAWAATSGVSWITVLTGASGSGSGTVTYRVDANPAGQSRTGTIAIGGRLLTVTQTAASCAATLSSTTESVEATGGSRVVSVTIPSGCVWTAFSNASWITVTSGGGPNSSGSAAVTFSVAANTATTPRTGTLTVSGRTVTVEQAGTCEVTLSPTSVSSGADAAAGSVGVSAGSSCSWTASSSAAWLTVTSGSSGSGDGTVGYSIAANTSNTSRTGTLTIGGRVFSVTQSAPTCAAVLSTTSLTVTSGVAIRSLQVTTAAGCAWTAVSGASWITITSGASGTGSGTVSYGVSANTSTSSRTGSMTIAGQTVEITQSGVPCTIGLTPSSVSLTSAGTNASVAVSTTAGCSWSASSNAAWLTVTSGASGDGNGTVQYSVAPNTSPTSRSGTITIGGRTFTVSQAGVSCTSTLSGSSVSIGPAAEDINVGVTSGAECNWTASSSLSWIAVSGGSSGTGPGTVTLSVAENTSASTRSGSVTIAGRLFTVIQAGACDYAVSPTALTVGGGNSQGAVWVTAGASCAWTAQSSVSWATLSTTTGTGTGFVTVTVAANPSTSPRTATLTIGGTPVTLTQGGAACHFTVSPMEMTVTGGTRSVNVTAPAGCAWTATTTSAWITFPDGAGGSGTGALTVLFSPNPTSFGRIGFINIAGWRVFVTQRSSSPPTAPGGIRIIE